MRSALRSLKALADQNRLSIVAVLQSGEFNVGELASILRIGQSRVSRHLRILLDAGLVAAKRDGTSVFYRLSDRSPASAWRWAHHQLPAKLAETRTGRSFDRRVENCLATRRERSRTFFESVGEKAADLHREILGELGYVEAILEWTNPGGSVVELGTGTGVLFERLASRADKLIGVEASPGMLEVTRRRIQRLQADWIELRLGEVEHLPVANGEADQVVAAMVLHHLPDPNRALLEASRVLAPGGILLVAELIKHADEELRDSLGDQWLGFEPDELVAWMEEAGFGNAESLTLPHTQRGFSAFLARGVRP